MCANSGAIPLKSGRAHPRNQRIGTSDRVEVSKSESSSPVDFSQQGLLLWTTANTVRGVHFRLLPNFLCVLLALWKITGFGLEYKTIQWSLHSHVPKPSKTIQCIVLLIRTSHWLRMKFYCAWSRLVGQSE